jgi:very-short-patch-repair endonuclease
MAAVLACGPEAVLSHGTAAALWKIRPNRTGPVEVSVPLHVRRRRKGIVVHRRRLIVGRDITRQHGIPVTDPICTLIDIAAQLEPELTEAAINEADRRGLTNPESLRASLDERGRRPGVRALSDILDLRTFAPTDSELERDFLKLIDELGLSKPQTGKWINGFKVDFYWPELGLVVETDGLRYHRTPAQQARDRLRDQAQTAAGLTPLRFTAAQVRFEPEYVREVLAKITRKLRSDGRRFPERY